MTSDIVRKNKEMGQDIETTVRLYSSLKRIRLVEEEIARIYPTDKIKSPTHLSIGQEAVSVGVCEALNVEDIVFGTYRGHAMYLAKKGDLKKMIAELYGKATGCAKGKGGSMHLVDTAHGVMGTSAVVATTIPNAVGYAHALKYQKKNSIVVSFFGDGAVEEGVFWESINFATLKKLPVIFVCENNQYAIHSRLSDRQANENISEKVKVHGLPVKVIDGNDVFGLYHYTSEIVEQMRTGSSGPVFVECSTCRWRGHVGPEEDFILDYRSQSEVEGWISRDPIRQLGDIIGEGRRQVVDDAIQSEIAEAFEFAESSPFPDSSELFTDLFKEA
jgi:TPP-dependent pyruvate/acetoin dehydrogenase alpha subunit